MFLRLLSILVFMVCAGNIAAQTGNNDYNATKTDPRLAQLLRNVEVFHLEVGITQLRTRMVDGVRGTDYLPHAYNHFGFVLQYFPNHPRALLLLTEVCEIWKEPKKCNLEGFFDNAIKVSRNDAVIHLTKGIYLHRNGKLKEAIESYKRSLDINPDSFNAHYNIGLAYVAQGQYSLANEHAQQAYSVGALPPGLRNKLVAVGAWKTIEAKSAEQPARAADKQTGDTDAATPSSAGAKINESAPDAPEEARNDRGNQ